MHTRTERENSSVQSSAGVKFVVCVQILRIKLILIERYAADNLRNGHDNWLPKIPSMMREGA